MARARKPDQDRIVLVKLAQIRPAPWNPRKSANEETICELAQSIREIGLRTPIQIRPKDGPDGEKFEIVSGHRRFEAVKRIAAETGTAAPTIKAVIENLEDDAAYLANLGEQIQREQLTDAEEAAAFGDYARRYPEDGATDLMLRTGKSFAFVLRRIAVAGLPKSLQWAWRQDIVSIGHMEQFLRITSKKEQLLLLKEIVANHLAGDPMTVFEMKAKIDRQAVNLSNAKFDPGQCNVCANNSQVQKSLFGVGDKALCGNAKCFIEKQRAWLIENWESLGFGSNTFRMQGVDKFEWQHTHAVSKEPCRTCPDYGTVVTIAGEEYYKSMCFGKPECHKQHYSFQTKSEKTRKTEDEPRVAWHGEFFRQQFYRERMPAVICEVHAADRLKAQKVQLALLLRRHSELHPWFQTETGFVGENGEPKAQHLGMKSLIGLADALGQEKVERLLSEGAVHVLCAEKILEDMDRQLVAAYLGILPDQWRITSEYLKKKQKPEILKIVADLQFMKDQGFLLTMLKKNLHSFSDLSNLKKGELIDLIIKSGAAVPGRVPAEVLSMREPSPESWEWREGSFNSGTQEDSGSGKGNPFPAADWEEEADPIDAEDDAFEEAI